MEGQAGTGADLGERLGGVRRRQPDAADPAADGLGVGQHRGLVRAGQEDCELVTADAGGRVVRMQNPPKRAAHLLEDLIPNQVPVLVVDLLEAIEIEKQDRAEADAVGKRIAREGRQRLREALAVPQACQRVALRRLVRPPVAGHARRQALKPLQ